MTQAAFNFPTLSIPDIQTGLADMFGLSIDEGSFKRPDAAMWQEIFLKILCEVTGSPVDSHIQQPLMVHDFDYPDLYTESIPLMHLTICMKKIMQGIGVPDFGHGDLSVPTSRRLQKLCSALINFQRFRMTKMDTYLAIKAGIDQQREHHDTLLKRNEELKQKINGIKAERAQQEPEVLKVQEQKEQLNARMQEHHRNQNTLQRQITEVKTRKEEKKAQTDQLKLAQIKAKDEKERLAMKIVQSPERVRHEQESMEQQLMALKEGLEMKRHRLTELKTQRENVRKRATDAEKGLQLLEAIQKSNNKENEIDAEIAHIGDKCQDMVLQQHELNTRYDQLQHMVTSRQEKMAKLSLQHQSRMKVLQEQIASLKEQRETMMQKQSSEARKKSQKLDYKRKKEEEIKRKQEEIDMKIKKLMEMYSHLLESNDNFDRPFENFTGDLKKCFLKDS